MYVSYSPLSAQASCIPLLGLFSTLPEVRDAAVAPALIGITLSVSVCLCLVRICRTGHPVTGNSDFEDWPATLFEKNIHFYMNFTAKGGIPQKTFS